MAKRRWPIITLLSDFGSKDPYVAAMKGVILTINPRCLLIDLSHQVRPHDVEEAALILAQVYSFFPRGTIHLAVVDPGVGGPRKPLLFVTENYFFVGPDNGLFSLALASEKPKQVVLLKNKEFFRPEISGTFHGRDLFAPVAAHLSLGVRPDSFGPLITSWRRIRLPSPTVRGDRFVGEILHVDGFGNLVTNIDRQNLLKFAKGDRIEVQAGGTRISGLKKGYWQGRKGEPIALFGSAGFLEISIREGSAQRSLGLNRGDSVVVRRRE